MTRTFDALTATSARRPIANFGTALLLLGGVATLTWFLGSSNPFTPAGYVGYLTKGAIVGRSHFYGIQRGPTSSGRAWLLDVTNVSVTPYTLHRGLHGERNGPEPRQPEDRVPGAHGVARRRQ